MSQIPPPLSIIAITAFGPVLVGLALFVPKTLRWLPGMRWLRGLGPRASRFTVVVIGSGMFGFGLNRLDLLPKSAFVIGSFIWLLLMAAAAAYDFGKAVSRWEPPASGVARKSVLLPSKDHRAAKRRSRRRDG